MMLPESGAPLSALDLHVLLVLMREDLYGYAILKRVESESGGSVRVEIGSLYRVLARLMEAGLVEETVPPPDAPASHRGLPRRYYGITAEGRSAVRTEASRLDEVLRLARSVLKEGGAR